MSEQILTSNLTFCGASADYQPYINKFMAKSTLLNNDAFALAAVSLVIEEDDCAPNDHLRLIESMSLATEAATADKYGINQTATPVGIYGPVRDVENNTDVNVALAYVLVSMDPETEDRAQAVTDTEQLLIDAIHEQLDKEGVRFTVQSYDLYTALDLLDNGDTLAPDAISDEDMDEDGKNNGGDGDGDVGFNYVAVQTAPRSTPTPPPRYPMTQRK